MRIRLARPARGLTIKRGMSIDDLLGPDLPSPTIGAPSDREVGRRSRRLRLLALRRWNRSYLRVAFPCGAKLVFQREHRHDQTVAGVLATQLGMRLSSEGLWVSSVARRTMPIDLKTRIVLVLISSEVRKYVSDRDDGQCQHCGATQNLELDHIIPLSRGGLNTEKTCKFFVRPASAAR